MTLLNVPLQMEGLGGMLPLLLMFVVLYFFMIRPQIRKQKKEKAFQESLAKGTKIVTTSGIHGKINEIANDGTIIVETGAGKLKMEKSAISLELTDKLNKVK